MVLVRQPHCKRGHKFTLDNTYIRANGTRACKKCQRVRVQSWRKTNPKKHKEYSRSYCKINSEKFNERTRVWKQINPEKRRAQHRRRRANELNQLGNFSNWMVNYYRYSQAGCCFYCNKKINSKFSAGAPGREILEHLTPLARGGLHCWTNTALACWKCNAAKGIKTVEEYREDIRK